MASISIMQDIRSLLSQGKSAAEVIALGYKPPTVYKVRRKMQKQDGVETTQLDRDAAVVTESTQVQDSVDVALLRQQLANLETEVAAAWAHVEDLLEETDDVAALTERVAMAQGEARSWQGKTVEAQQSRDDVQRQLGEARKEIQSLRQLLVWEGHPCCECGEPMSGTLVDRETAARILSHAGHRACLERQGLVKTTWHHFSGPKSAKGIVLAERAYFDIEGYGQVLAPVDPGRFANELIASIERRFS